MSWVSWDFSWDSVFPNSPTTALSFPFRTILGVGAIADNINKNNNLRNVFDAGVNYSTLPLLKVALLSKLLQMLAFSVPVSLSWGFSWDLL